MTAATEPFDNWLDSIAATVESRLESILPPPGGALADAMRYATLGGGKRIRPAVVFAVAGETEPALACACALELIHCYSLVHDDLPCMDDDDMRRNKPACHKKFGEATAVLAGDCMQSLAFETLAGSDAPRQTLVYLADAAGCRGMGGGQALDIASDADIERMSWLKTGALFHCALQMGAACRSAAEAPEQQALDGFSRGFGLLFQIANDISDYEQDKARDKQTFATRADVDERECARRAKQDALDSLGGHFPRLAQITQRVYAA